MNGGLQPSRLLAGEVGKSHGLAGEVYVVRISDDPHRFDAGAKLERADGESLTVESVRIHGDRMLVKFVEVADREAAGALRGPLYVPARSLRELDDGEFWHHELIGMSATTTDGQPIGTVVEVVPGPAQDLLSLDTKNGTRFVPFVDEIVVGVDRSTRVVTIDPPAGLLD